MLVVWMILCTSVPIYGIFTCVLGLDSVLYLLKPHRKRELAWFVPVTHSLVSRSCSSTVWSIYRQACTYASWASMFQIGTQHNRLASWHWKGCFRGSYRDVVVDHPELQSRTIADAVLSQWQSSICIGHPLSLHSPLAMAVTGAGSEHH